MTWTGKTSFRTGESMIVDDATGAIIAHVCPAETMETTARRAHTMAASEELRDSLKGLLVLLPPDILIAWPGGTQADVSDMLDRYTAARESSLRALAVAERSGP